MIRIVEQHDWVIYCIIGIVFSYIIMFRTLHRNISLAEYVTQSYEDSSNRMLSWLFTTLLYALSFSLLFSQYLPIVPRFITEYRSFFGWHFNKLGFMLVSLLLFYLLKNVATYLFYGSIHELKKFGRYAFVAQKYYLLYSLLLLLLSFFHHYLPVNQPSLFVYYTVGTIFAFVFKIALYVFHHQQILPSQWYYKILYICTLQILPSLMIWKIWFF